MEFGTRRETHGDRAREATPPAGVELPSEKGAEVPFPHGRVPLLLNSVRFSMDLLRSPTDLPGRNTVLQEMTYLVSIIPAPPLAVNLPKSVGMPPTGIEPQNCWARGLRKEASDGTMEHFL